MLVPSQFYMMPSCYAVAIIALSLMCNLRAEEFRIELPAGVPLPPVSMMICHMFVQKMLTLCHHRESKKPTAQPSKSMKALS